MSYTSLASLFDNREALARGGETDVGETTCATASKHLETAGDAWLAERGFDANANELTPGGAHVVSTCLMSQGTVARASTRSATA